MTLRDIARLHLVNQRITQSDFKTSADVVRYMGAMQAQDYASAKWAIGLRLPGSTEVDIEQAVRDRTILRTWPQRGTIHFVVPEEVRWRLSLSTPRILAGAKTRHANLKLDDATFAQALEMFTMALQGDKQLSRPNMMKILEDGGISTANQRGYHILWYLAQTGHLCFGPLEGKQVTFALLNEWIPKTPEISRTEALKRLTTSYFVSHGPATMQDLMWWSGMTAADIKLGLELSTGSLMSEDIDGRTYWMSRELPDMKLPLSAVYLLPSFDELLLGYKDRSATLDLAHMPKIVPGMNGMFAATIVIDGKVEGIWRRTIKKNEIIVELAPFGDLSVIQKRRIETAITSYGKYMGLSATILNA